MSAAGSGATDRRGRGYKNLRYLLLKAQRIGGHQYRIRRVPQSSLKCGPVRFSRRALIPRWPFNMVNV
jgi:hypothetical protein